MTWTTGDEFSVLSCMLTDNSSSVLRHKHPWFLQLCCVSVQYFNFMSMMWWTMLIHICLRDYFSFLSVFCGTCIQTIPTIYTIIDTTLKNMWLSNSLRLTLQFGINLGVQFGKRCTIVQTYNLTSKFLKKFMTFGSQTQENGMKIKLQLSLVNKHFKMGWISWQRGIQ